MGFMSAEKLKGWVLLARELVGFTRDLIGAIKEAREEKAARNKKEEPKKDEDKKT
jgi:hypothetical protein